MTVTLSFSAETEKALQAKAASSGLTLKSYLEGLAERDAIDQNGTQPIPRQLDADEWAAAWQAWGDTDRGLSVSQMVDDSRESIYAGRGE